MPIPFPLNIPEKEDSFEKELLLANVPAQFKYTAAEFNQIVAALTYLYLNGGGGSGDVYWLGTFTSISALTLAHPAPFEGSIANIDPTTGVDVTRALWDNNDNKWVTGGVVSDLQTQIFTATTKAAMADADLSIWLDSTDGMKLVKRTLAHQKAALKTYFDTLYLTTSTLFENNIKGKLIKANVAATYIINCNTASDYHLTMTEATSFTFSNRPTGLVVQRTKLRLTGAFAPTFPAYLFRKGDAYVGTKWNDIIVELWEVSTGVYKGIIVFSEAETV